MYVPEISTLFVTLFIPSLSVPKHYNPDPVVFTVLVSSTFLLLSTITTVVNMSHKIFFRLTCNVVFFSVGLLFEFANADVEKLNKSNPLNKIFFINKLVISSLNMNSSFFDYRTTNLISAFLINTLRNKSFGSNFFSITINKFHIC